MALKPRKFDAARVAELSASLSTQKIVRGAQKSLDPENYPVFEIPPGQKVSLYIPRHIVTNEEGFESLREDKALIHRIDLKGRYQTVRCVNGLSALGYETCPLCDVNGLAFEVANKFIERELTAKGLDPEDRTSDAVKAVRREHYGNMPVQTPSASHTFPVIILETTPDGKGLITEKGADGKEVPKFKATWMVASENAWEKKWLAALDSLDDDPDHFAGQFARLNFPVTEEAKQKGGSNAKRDAGRDMTVNFRDYPALHSLRKQWDELTEDWDVLKATETVTANQLYDAEGIQELANDIELHLTALLEVANAGAGAPAAPSSLSTDFKVGGAVQQGGETLGILDASEIDGED